PHEHSEPPIRTRKQGTAARPARGIAREVDRAAARDLPRPGQRGQDRRNRPRQDEGPDPRDRRTRAAGPLSRVGYTAPTPHEPAAGDLIAGRVGTRRPTNSGGPSP